MLGNSPIVLAASQAGQALWSSCPLVLPSLPSSGVLWEAIIVPFAFRWTLGEEREEFREWTN